ncbi:hypothetical protein NPIL_464291, partial [Nephila pilipes]
SAAVHSKNKGGKKSSFGKPRKRNYRRRK